MWNRIAWLAGAFLALAAFSPLQAQTVNPDCTGTGLSGPGVNLLICTPTGCTVNCVGAATATPWGPNTGVVCQCNIIGPPLDCCRLVGIKFPAGGVGYTTQGQCDFPNCNDTGKCKLGSAPAGGGLLKLYAVCLKDGENPQYGDINVYFATSEGSADGGDLIVEEGGDGDGGGD